MAWLRIVEDLGDDELLQRCAIAYLSDDLPTDSVIELWPNGEGGDGSRYTASLDHTIWFHRPMRADRWHLYDFTCHGIMGGRGLAIGHVFDDAGSHLATIAQEVLVRAVRDRAASR
jgi:acyl-CoA thioesterase-2